MQFLKHNIISKILFVSFLVAVSVPFTSRASSAGAASAESGGEEKVADNGYDKKLTKFNTYQSEMKSLRVSIQAAIKELKGMKKSNSLYEKVMEKIVILHEDLERAVKNYNNMGRELQHKFPEKSNLESRKYFPYRQQSIEQIEKELDLDDILTEVGDVVYRKYEAFAKKDEKRVRPLKKKKKEKKDKQKNIEVSF